MVVKIVDPTMKIIDPSLWSVGEHRRLIRRMITKNETRQYNLITTIGGINLTWLLDTDEVDDCNCRLKGPGWSIHAEMIQSNGKLDFNRDLILTGDEKRFDTDIIFIKMALP